MNQHNIEDDIVDLVASALGGKHEAFDALLGFYARRKVAIISSSVAVAMTVGIYILSPQNALVFYKTQDAPAYTSTPGAL